MSASLTVGAELSKPFAKHLFVSVMWSCRGTLRLLTSAPRLRFAFGKASAAVTLVSHLKCSEVLPPPIPLPLPSWFSSYCSVTATLIPPLPTPQLARYCSTPVVDLRSLYKNLPQLPLSSWPSLMPLWQTLRRLLTRVASIHRPILPSATVLSPGTTPVYRSILSLPSSG